MISNLDNRYQIVQKLGTGGFGETYLAIDTQVPSRRQCVIKQLKQVSSDPSLSLLIKQRFEREAAILESLGENCGQIPKLYAYFNYQEEYYLVQQYIKGQTLAQTLKSYGLYNDTAILQFLLQLLPVLDYVHGEGIIHRDIKPDNIIIPDERPLSPVLIDFGAVKETVATNMISSGNPKSSIVIGTPGYMPPEQSIGKPIYSSDLYSLALTAIYLMTGKHPQDLDSDLGTAEFKWIDFVPHINPDLAKVLDRAIRYHPRDRYSNAKEMQSALLSLPINHESTKQVNHLQKLPTQIQPTIPIPVEPKQSRYLLWGSIVGIGFIGLVTVITLIIYQFIPRVITSDDPASALRAYYNSINEANYNQAWNQLALDYRNNTTIHPQGYDSYLDWWNQVESVDILDISNQRKEGDKSLVTLDLKYYLKSNRIIQQKLTFTLTKDPSDQEWKIMGVERISSTETPTPTPTPTVTVTITPTPTATVTVTPSEPVLTTPSSDPRESISNYYQHLNNGNYNMGWNILTNGYQNNSKTHPNGFQSYQTFWDTIDSVEILGMDTIEQNDYEAVVATKLKYNRSSGSSFIERLKFYLIWDSAEQSWKINRTERMRKN